MDLRGKRALVTGGSAGIGRELAVQLAARGAKAIIVGRNEAHLQRSASLAPDSITALQADLSMPDEQQRVVAEVSRHWPDLAILINNAGVQVNMAVGGLGDDGQLAALRSEIEVNLTAPIALSFGLMPLLARQQQAAIVNIASGLALAPKRTAPVYCATKAGLRTFTRALRYRCEDAAPTIRVVDVVMALVDTDMTRGRGRGKISASAAAGEVLDGISHDTSEIWVGKAKLLRALNRATPTLAFWLFRNG